MPNDIKIAIIGGGILGTSLAYFLSSHSAKTNSVILLEQEKNIAFHTSSRNTGKVHAPFLYDPAKKKTFAKAAALGYDMWREYSKQKNLTFKRDGVLEIAEDDSGIERLEKYMKWGVANGLTKDELQFLDSSEAKKIEPNVQCAAAIYCSRDASVNYGELSRSLIEDCRSFGCSVLLGHRATKISFQNGIYSISTDQGTTIEAEFLINAAGGNAMDIAHLIGVAKDYTDLHFRGEYWQTPPEYHDLTKLSIYSVPKYPEYPFLDPHWIVRADGRREVGPNAVPVFGPYAYAWSNNLRHFIPKIFESSRTGARKMVFDRQFLSLASNEFKSSLSKTAMINRVRRFLPQIKPSAFKQRGTSGIRSSVIDKEGKFVPDTLVIKKDSSIHILNYNSPGATGALPMAAMIASQLVKDTGLPASDQKSIWSIESVADKMNA